MKKTVCMVLVLIMLLSMVGISTAENNAAATAVELQQHKIGVALYTDTGKSVEAIKAFLAGISEDVGCTFVYTTLTTYDEATNKTKIQELISAGCKGIIMTVDMGTEAILVECEKAGVYLAGFLCDFNTSYNMAYEAVFGSDYFLGTVCDGWFDQSPWGRQVAEKVIEDGFKNVGVFVFPDYAYPMMTGVDNEFRSTIADYNSSVASDEQIQLVDTTVLNFSPMEATYLNQHADLDAIFSICAGASNVYGTLVAEGRTDIKLYTQGFEGTDDVDNFGVNGNNCYQGVMFSSPEAIVYPLCLIIDALNGASYSDAPAVAERVDCSEIIVFTNEELDAVVNNSIYYDADFSKAFLTGEDVRNLCASYSNGASYENLVQVLQDMGINALMIR